MNDNTTRGAEGALNNARDTIRATAADLASQAKEKAGEQFESGMGTARTEISGIATALRRVGEQMRQENSSSMTAGIFTAIADRAETLGNSFEGRDLDGMVNDIGRLARRNPAAFAGTAAALGFLAVRFFKSSGRTSWQDEDNSFARRDYFLSTPGYGSGMGSSGYESGSRNPAYGSGAPATGYGTTSGWDSQRGSGSAGSTSGSGLGNTGLSGSGLSGTNSGSGVTGSGTSATGNTTKDNTSNPSSANRGTRGGSGTEGL